MWCCKYKGDWRKKKVFLDRGCWEEVMSNMRETYKNKSFFLACDLGHCESWSMWSLWLWSCYVWRTLFATVSSYSFKRNLGPCKHNTWCRVWNSFSSISEIMIYLFQKLWRLLSFKAHIAIFYECHLARFHASSLGSTCNQEWLTGEELQPSHCSWSFLKCVICCAWHKSMSSNPMWELCCWGLW